MAIEKEDKKGKEKKGSSKGIERSGLKEERMGEDFVIKRVLESVRSGKEDKEAFEELRRINKEKRKEIGEDAANKLGKELLEECKKEVGVSIEKIIDLILKGANLNFKDENGDTALRWAFSHKNEKIKITLLNSGATVIWVRDQKIRSHKS
ncbi:MAG: hypothetical protein QW035_03685 [Candidatus Anstonellales archaeon]